MFETPGIEQKNIFLMDTHCSLVSRLIIDLDEY